jgi:hypothetical protein
MAPMHVLLVAYNINTNKTKTPEEEKNEQSEAAERRKNVLDFIKKHNPQEISESAYIVGVTDVIDFRTKLPPLTRKGDDLFILSVNGRHSAFGKHAPWIEEWLPLLK